MSAGALGLPASGAAAPGGPVPAAVAAAPRAPLPASGAAAPGGPLPATVAAAPGAPVRCAPGERAPADCAELEAVRGRFERLARVECAGRSPLWAEVCRAVADDEQALALMLCAPRHQRRPTLLLAAIHDLLLSGVQHELAAHVPTVAGARAPATGGAGALALAFCREHRDALARLLATRSTQTNEVNRAAALLPALVHATPPGQPLRLVELGASAGLNLLVDRFAYRYHPAAGPSAVARGAPAQPPGASSPSAVARGAPAQPPGAASPFAVARGAPAQPPGAASPSAVARGAPARPSGTPTPCAAAPWPAAGRVVCDCVVDGRLPELVALRIAERVGVDLDPRDVRDDDAARWLLACVWPDEPDRVARLRAAIELARADPPRVVRGDALALLPELVGEPGPHPVLWHSWVLAYWTPAAQRALAAAIDELGAGRDLTWLYLEQPSETPGLPTPVLPGIRHDPDDSALVAVTWRDGARTVQRLADAHPHAHHLRWHAAAAR